MAAGAPTGNQNARGSKGGGRIKKGDEAFLLDLWEGKIKLPKVIFRDEIYWDRPILKDGSVGKRLIKQKRRIETFKSGKDAFAYMILRGDDTSLRALLSKLYPDQKAVEIINPEDRPIPIQVYMPKKQPIKDTLNDPAQEPSISPGPEAPTGTAGRVPVA